MILRYLCLLGLVCLSITLAAEPVSYRLVNEAGRLVIRASTGETLSWQGYGLSSDINLEEWKEKQPALVRNGVRLFQITPRPGTVFWGNPFSGADDVTIGEPEESPLIAEKAEYLLELTPDARFIVRFDFAPGPAWREANLAEYEPYLETTDGYARRPSIASEAGIAHSVELIRTVIAWCERQPWRDRIVGYALFPYGEGITENALHGRLFDASGAMTNAFRQAMRETYADDAALQQAWSDDTVTLDTIAIPTHAEWLQKRDDLKLLHWPRPEQVRRERDYFRVRGQLYERYWIAILDALGEATADRPVITGVDAFKQPLQGWMLSPDFFGTWEPRLLDDFGHALLGSGAIGMGPVLDHPALQMLQTPGMYFNRAIGYAWEAEGVTDSLVLRGKLNYMEADMRTYIRMTWQGRSLPRDKMIDDAGVFMTPVEVQAGFDRTLAWALTRNQMYYYMSVCGANWWFHDSEVERVVANQRASIQRGMQLPWQETTDVICMVIDDTSAIHEDFSSGFQYLAVYRQIEEGLALAGLPYRLHLLSDLARDDFPDYKCYLFPNLFKVDEATLELLRTKVLRNGNLAIFGPGTGITDGDRLSADGASALLGVPMELVDKSVPRRTMLQDHGHPISQRLGTMTYGDSYAYGPILAPREQIFTADEATQLGAVFLYYFIDRPGLFIRETADYKVVFTPTVPLPPEVLRECARYAGCHIYSDRNAVIYASEQIVALHTSQRGPHLLRLPRETPVYDLITGEKLADNVSEITLQVDGPTTRILWLGEPPFDQP